MAGCEKNREEFPVILFCGDTFLKTQNGADPFCKISKLFSGKWVCINLETSLKSKTTKRKHISLHIEEKQLDFITENIRIVSAVNNHVWDSGDPGKLVRALKGRGKVVVGPNNPSQTEILINGQSVGFFSAYFSLPRFRLSYKGRTAAALERLVRKSTAVCKIVNLHWGYEHTNIPAPFQRSLGHRLIDAGADLIIGHHPHVPQGYEIYKGKAIYYSLGNFNFRLSRTEPTKNKRWGYMVSYDLETGGSDVIPYLINENCQPCIVSCGTEKELKDALDHLSKDLKSIDYANWFKTEYDQWFKRELQVWKRLCRQKISPKLWIKWAAWLSLPIQIRYYWHKISSYPLGKRV